MSKKDFAALVDLVRQGIISAYRLTDGKIKLVTTSRAGEFLAQNSGAQKMSLDEVKNTKEIQEA